MAQGSGGLRGEKRVNVDKSGVVKYDAEGEHFELLVDTKLAWDYREGKEVTITDVLMGSSIFYDALRGKQATDISLRKAFDTEDILVIAKIILDKGDLKLTTDQRRKITEQKRRQVITFLSKNAVNPETGYPHPPERLDRALTEAKVNIDPFKPAEEQAKEYVKLLMPIIPIRMEQVKIAIQIPSEYTGKGYGIVTRYGNINEEEWQKDGSWVGIVEISGAVQGSLLGELNKLTKGRVQTKLIKSK
ncbi:MAG: ribosome assembly factor SBDS [Candidatus Ranarchaeia archaeon]|jgi:ribosome maturation protein SDO1